MSKALMISIRPEHAVNILNGKKTLELRTWIPKDYVGWVYVYVTKKKPYLTEVVIDEYFNTDYELFNIPSFGDADLNGKIVARFWFDEFEKVDLELVDKSGYDEDKQMHYESTNLSNEELQQKTCLSNEEIEKYLDDNGGYIWHIKNLEIFDKPLDLKSFGLKKAPQSYCYVRR